MAYVQSSDFRVQYLHTGFFLHACVIRSDCLHQSEDATKCRKLIKAPDAASLFKAIVQY